MIPLGSGSLLTLWLTAPPPLAEMSGKGTDGGWVWSAQVPRWMCMAWLLLGVKPCISTAVVMSLVVGFQVTLAVPVGISANWIVGRLSPAVEGPGGDEEGVPVEFEHAPRISAPAAVRHTAACRSTAITPGQAGSLAALRHDVHHHTNPCPEFSVAISGSSRWTSNSSGLHVLPGADNLHVNSSLPRRSRPPLTQDSHHSYVPGVTSTWSSHWAPAAGDRSLDRNEQHHPALGHHPANHAPPRRANSDEGSACTC